MSTDVGGGQNEFLVGPIPVGDQLSEATMQAGKEIKLTCFIQNQKHQILQQAKIINATTLEKIAPHTQLNILPNTIVTPLARQVALERNINPH